MNLLRTQSLAVLLGSLSTCVALAAPTSCQRVSPAHTVALLELYSSEGCNSCPPADQLVSTIVASKLSTDQVIPVALHVDYWDYIGWKDRFATPAYTQRQYWLSEKNTGRRSAYTPEFFLAGKEWRDWGSSELIPALRATNAQPALVDISLKVQSDDGAAIKVETGVISKIKNDEVQIFVALAQDGLVSAVKAGENSGVTLHHDAVVRQWFGPYSGAARLELNRPADAGKLSVIAFAQNVRTGQVLQALSVPLSCKS